jgi:glutathione S-transferase
LSHFPTVENAADRRYGIERCSAETRRLYGVLDQRLGEVEFVGGDISTADFAILGWHGGASATGSLWHTSRMSGGRIRIRH